MPALQLDGKLVKTLKDWIASGDPLDLPQVLQDLGVKKQWQLLATPLGQLPQEREPEVVLPLLDKKGTASTSQFGWDWGAKAGASATVTVDVLDPSQLEALKIQPGDGHIALSFGADLALSAGLTGNQAFGAWGQASASLSAEAGAQLHWYFGGALSDRLIDTLVDSTRYWLLPNDYDGLMKLADSPNFWGLRLDLTGTLEAQLSAGAKAGWTGWTYGLDGERAQIGLSVGLDARVSFKKRSELSLHVRPEQRRNEWGLKVELDVLDARSDAFALTLAAAIDLSALAASAERALRAAWPEIDESRLTLLTQPGTALGEALGDIVKSKIKPADLQQLALVALGQADVDAAKADWLERLTAPLSGALDGALAGIADGTMKVETLVAQWVDGLVGSSPAAAGLAAQLRTAAAEALKRATKQLSDQIGALDTQIGGAAGSALDKVLTPLGALGDRVAQALKDLNAGSVPTAIRKALADYAGARTRLLAALSDAKKAKIGLALSAELQRSSSTSLAFSGWFSAKGDQAAAQRLYQSLCSGRIALFGDLVDAAQAGHSLELDAGWLAATAKAIRTESVVLNLFGAEFSTSRVSLIDMEFKADPWGRVIVAKALASVDARTLNPWLERSVSLGVSATLAKPEGVAQVDVGLEGSFAARGKSTDQAFVQHVVDDYAAQLGVRAPRDVGELLGAPRTLESAQKFWRDLVLALPVRLDAASWRQFEGSSRRTVEETFLKHGLRCLDQQYADRKGFRFTTPSKDLLKQANEFFKGDTDAGRMVAYLHEFKAKRLDPREPDFSYAESVGYGGVQHAQLSDTNVQFAVFHRFAGLIRAAATLHGAAPRLREAMLGGPEKELPAAMRGRVEPILRDVRDALQAFAVASDTLTGIGIGTFDEGLTWAFNTFVLAMADLAGKLPPGFLLVAQRPGEEMPTPLLIG